LCIANDIRGMLYQMARELLQNVAKHAEADCVKLSIRLDRQTLRILVEDNGRGFEDPAVTSASKQKTGGFGLFSIRERLGHMGGRLEVRPGIEGAGACVTIVLPLKAAYLKESENGQDQNTPGRRPSVDAGRTAGASREAG
jgi:signal transduction histidine kinase